jgi:hypothetical protein
MIQGDDNQKVYERAGEQSNNCRADFDRLHTPFGATQLVINEMLVIERLVSRRARSHRSVLNQVAGPTSYNIIWNEFVTQQVKMTARIAFGTATMPTCINSARKVTTYA